MRRGTDKRMQSNAPLAILRKELHSSVKWEGMQVIGHFISTT